MFKQKDEKMKREERKDKKTKKREKTIELEVKRSKKERQVSLVPKQITQLAGSLAIEQEVWGYQRQKGIQFIGVQ